MLYGWYRPNLSLGCDDLLWFELGARASAAVISSGRLFNWFVVERATMALGRGSHCGAAHGACEGVYDAW